MNFVFTRLGLGTVKPLIESPSLYARPSFYCTGFIGPLAYIAVAVLLVLEISHKRLYDYYISYKALTKKTLQNGKLQHMKIQHVCGRN